MTRLTPTKVADAILQAPGWARVGITAPSVRLREDAAHELAKAIIEKTEGPPTDALGLQGTLPL